MISTIFFNGLLGIVLVLRREWWRAFGIGNGLELNSLAHMGRLGFVEGTLELVEYPYLIIYQVDDARREVIVLSIVHGARDRES